MPLQHSANLSKKEIKTISLLKVATDILKKHNIEDAYLNAEILLSHILGKEREKLYAEDIEMDRKKIGLFFKLVKKRCRRIPLQYLTGKANFFGYSFFVENGVFIPRPETEILVEKTIEIYKNFFYPQKIKILDIGTGCGNIAITLAKEIENSYIIGTDISKKSIKIAQKNSIYHNVEEKTEFIRKNLFPEEGKFHIIVTNPPYIPKSEIKNLQEEVKKEPLIAIDGGVDGLKYIREILNGAEKYLYKNGFLIMEIGENQTSLIKEEVKEKNLKLIKIEKDLQNFERICIFKYN